MTDKEYAEVSRCINCQKIVWRIGSTGPWRHYEKALWICIDLPGKYAEGPSNVRS